MLKGLKGEADRDDNKVVTAAELYRYVLDNVEEHSKKKFFRQTPLVSHAFNPDFPLAVVGADVVKRVLNPAKSKVKLLSALAEYGNDPEAARCLVRVDKTLDVTWYTTSDIGIVHFNFNYKNTCSRSIQGAIAVAIGSKRRSDKGGWEMSDLKISEFFLEPNDTFTIKNTLRWAGRGLVTEERMPAIRYANPPQDTDLIRCQFFDHDDGIYQ